MEGLTANLFNTVLVHEARRGTMLDVLLQEDMMEASICSAIAGSGCEAAVDIAKHRVTKAVEFAKCKDCGCMIFVVLKDA